MKQTIKKTLMTTALATLLTACGGGSSGGGNGGSGGSTSTGVLSDSPVDGVSYSTSSGKSGTTNNKGEFDYTVGDTVTFTIGGLKIGEYKPRISREIVTPIQLAEALPEADRTNAITNLLILLQSLDEDGDPENGITISETTSTSLTDALAESDLDLTSDPDFFAAAAALQAALPDGNSVVTPADAQAHFTAQYFNNLAGVYYHSDFGTIIRFTAEGHYLHGSFENDEGAIGIELGTTTWAFATGINTISTDVDTQKNQWDEIAGAGFGDADGDLRFIPGLSSLLITETIDGHIDSVTMKRLESGADNSIVGTWAVATTPVAYDPETDIYTREPIPDAEKRIDTQQFVFFANGTYAMLDPVGDDESRVPGAPEECGQQGVEMGKYSFTSGQLHFSNNNVDNNGCGGLYGENGYSSTPMSATIDGNTMIWAIDNSSIPFALKRVTTQND